jgi:cell division protein FtsI/penicillin-binding protein 2
MLANFKCNEVKTVALQNVELEVQWFINESNTVLFEPNEFIKRCEAIKTNATNIYDLSAKNYLKHVYEDVRKQLITELAHRMNICFSNQCSRLIPQAQRNMRSELETERKKSK